MKDNRVFPHGLRRVVLALVVLTLAIGLTVGTVIYQRPSGLLCEGRLSAGFPVAFVCDASGESPLSSVGKIDWADVDGLNLIGSVVDIMFYVGLLWLARLGAHRFSGWVGQRTRRH